MVIQDANVTLNIPLWKYTRALALSTDSFLWRISHRGSDHRNLKIWRVKYSYTKISKRANNTIEKYFVFEHTYRQLPLNLKIWFEFWWCVGKIKTLENSQINLPLPALSHQWWVTPWRGLGGTRPTAAGEKWSNWNTNYDFLRRPPAPLPAPRWDRAAGWLFRCLSIIKWERSLMDNNSTSLGEQFI